MDFKFIPKIECPKCHESFRPMQLLKMIQLRSSVKKNSANGSTNKNRRLVNQGKICAICGEPLDIKWTIRHGEGYCACCGAPYNMFLIDEKGTRIKDVHCALKESTRPAYRSVYKAHGSSLEKYSETLDHVEVSNNAKNNIVGIKPKETIVTKDNMDIPSKMQPADILKVIGLIEKRNLDTLDEKIEILSGKGVLVHQRLTANPDNDPIYYSFERLHKMKSVLIK